MRSTNGDLLEALQDGMFEQPLWSTFLEMLRARSGARYVTFIFRPDDEEAVVELHAGPQPPGLGRRLREQYDSEFLSHRKMRAGRVYSLNELFEAHKPQLRAYCEEVLLPLGITQMQSVRVTEPSGVDVWLSFIGGRELGSSSASLLGMLVPHVRTALRCYIALERERFRSSVTSEAFHRMNFGWLSLDARCRIVDASPNLDQLLQRSDVLKRGRYDRLVPASPAVDRELTELVQRFAEQRDARPHAINLSRDPLIDLLVTPTTQRNVSSGSTPVAIAYLSGDRLSQADRCDQLVDLFGLLPSEARLAWAMAQGLSIAEAAKELGIALETARTYSKKIYSKTGAKGQTALVRNILTSVLALA